VVSEGKSGQRPSHHLPGFYTAKGVMNVPKREIFNTRAIGALRLIGQTLEACASHASGYSTTE